MPCAVNACPTLRARLVEGKPHDAEEGDKKAAVAVRMIESPGDFLAAIQVAITLVGFFSSAFAATTLSEPLGTWLAGFGMDVAVAHGLATVLITLIVSYFSIVVGELVPKRIAMADAETVSKNVAGPLSAFATCAKPLVCLTSASANGLAKLMGIKGTDDRQDVSEDEIRYMVTDSEDLSDEEKSMIHDVIDLGDTIAREVMIPRVDMTAMEDDSTLTEVLDVMVKREDVFLAVDSYVPIEQGVRVTRGDDAFDDAARQRLHVDWDACILWAGMEGDASSSGSFSMKNLVT